MEHIILNAIRDPPIVLCRHCGAQESLPSRGSFISIFQTDQFSRFVYVHRQCHLGQPRKEGEL